MTRKFVVLLFVLALVAAACGDSGDDPTTTAAPGTTEAATTTAAPATTEAPTTTEAMMDLATDVGVDTEAQTITIGLLSDLSGAFGPLVQAIVAGHEVYWEDVNANGGVEGYTVLLEVRDTAYVVDNHVQLYEELKDQVVAFGHSTGSPHTVAINEDLQDDGILAIPLTWYSGWSDPAINANLVPHGTPYCIEAMNLLEYMKGVAASTGNDDPTLAIASLPGDYGLDSAAGAALGAAALEMEVLLDLSGQIIPGQDLAPLGAQIAQSGADVLFITATPGTFAEVYGAAVQAGFAGLVTGASPNYNPALLDSALAPALEAAYFASSYLQPWGSDNPGMKNLMDTFAALRPDAPPNDFYGEGFVEAKIMHDILLKGLENGDITQSGLVTAAKQLESVDFNGLAPNETYVGDPNSRLQREIVIFRPSVALRDAGGTGADVVADAFTGSVAAAYEFTEACFQL